MQELPDQQLINELLLLFQRDLPDREASIAKNGLDKNYQLCQSIEQFRQRFPTLMSDTAIFHLRSLLSEYIVRDLANIPDRQRWLSLGEKYADLLWSKPFFDNLKAMKELDEESINMAYYVESNINLDLFIKLLYLANDPFGTFSLIEDKYYYLLSPDSYEQLRSMLENNKEAVEYHHITAYNITQLAAVAWRIRHLDFPYYVQLSIDLFEIALPYLDRNRDPMAYCEALANLAVSYSTKTSGDLASYVQKAKNLLKEALEHIPEEHKMFWADLHVLSGNLCTHITLQSDPDAIEEAITNFETALQTITPQVWPERAAQIMTNLAVNYYKRRKGNISENIERGLALLIESLPFLEKDTIPWANTHLNLSNAFRQRSKESKVLNLKQALWHTQQGRKVFSRDRYVAQWATATITLGITYFDIFKLTENVEYRDLALSNLHDAIAAVSPAEYPFEWANAQEMLAVTLQDLNKRGMAKLQDVVEAYIMLLPIYSQQADHYKWATVHLNLGILFSEQASVDWEKINYHFGNAEMIFTASKSPTIWADIQHNLGTLYFNVWTETRSEDHYARALTFLRKAYSHRDLRSSPEEMHNTSSGLGHLYYLKKDYNTALGYFLIADQAQELLRKEEASHQLKKKVPLYITTTAQHLVHCYLELNQPENALEFVLKAKNRLLRDRLQSEKIDIDEILKDDPSFAVSWEEIVSIRKEIHTLTDKLSDLVEAIHTSENVQQQKMRLKEKQKLETEIDHCYSLLRTSYSNLYFDFPILSSSSSAAPFDKEAIKALTRNQRITIIEYYHFGEGWVAFVIKNDEIHAVKLDNQPIESVIRQFHLLKRVTLRAGSPSPQEKIWCLHLFQALVLPWENLLSRGERIVISPFGALHHLPLWLAMDSSGSYLLDKYDMRLVYSSTVAKSFADIEPERDENLASVDDHVLTVFHEGEGHHRLSYIQQEIAAVSAAFKQMTLLSGKDASLANIKKACRENQFTALHFSCHGGFIEDLPEQSGLMLNEIITADLIALELKLKGRPLVVLSACETSSSEVRRGDELTGLAQSFLIAGAGRIIGSLWQVEDEAAGTIFKYFYEHRRKNGGNDSLALANAMKRLRSESRFESIFFWGAFQVIGL